MSSCCFTEREIEEFLEREGHKLNDNEKNVLGLMKHIPFGDTRSPLSTQWRDIIRALTEIRDVARRAHVIDVAGNLLNYSDGPDWYPLLMALQEVPDYQRSELALQATNLVPDTGSGRQLAHTLEVLAQMNVDERQDFLGLVTVMQLAVSLDLPWEESPVSVLSKMAPPERVNFVQQLFKLRQPEHPDFSEVYQFARDRGRDLEEFVEFAIWFERLVGDCIDLKLDMHGLRWLLSYPPEERDEILAAITELHAIHPESRGYYVWYLLGMAAGTRFQAAERVVAEYRSSPDPTQRLRQLQYDNEPGEIDEADDPNLENVMTTEWVEAVSKSIVALQEEFPDEIGDKQREDALDEMESFITDYRNVATAEELSVFRRHRGEATEFENFRRVVSGATRRGDLSDSLRENRLYIHTGGNIGVGDLTTLVWYAIHRYHDASLGECALAKVTRSMRYAVFLALAQCIDDDGHRVCNTGFASRIMRVLQGYYPFVNVDGDDPKAPPEQVVNHAAYRFSQELQGREPSRAEVQEFYETTMREAENVHARGTIQHNNVDLVLRTYLGMDFPGWNERS